jgi:hypothetical protein
MNAAERYALKEAVAKRRKDEPFEKALGRTMRTLGHDYEAYIQVIARVRELAKSRKIALDEAALALASEEV